jgi:hypothetical protein
MISSRGRVEIAAVTRFVVELPAKPFETEKDQA